MTRETEAVNIALAKARLSELVERASSGEEIILARHGKPKARLVPLEKKAKFVRGAGRGRWKGVERILEQELPSEVLDAFDRGDVSRK